MRPPRSRHRRRSERSLTGCRETRHPSARARPAASPSDARVGLTVPRDPLLDQLPGTLIHAPELGYFDRKPLRLRPNLSSVDASATVAFPGEFQTTMPRYVSLRIVSRSISAALLQGVRGLDSLAPSRDSSDMMRGLSRIDRGDQRPALRLVVFVCRDVSCSFWRLTNTRNSSRMPSRNARASSRDTCSGVSRSRCTIRLRSRNVSWAPPQITRIFTAWPPSVYRTCALSAEDAGADRARRDQQAENNAPQLAEE